MVLRDRDAGGDGVFEQRLYVQQDANFNVTSISDATGTVVERYAYDPYGAVTYLDANWGALGTSAYGWVYLHQGGRYDSTGGLYHFRNRELSPTLGRWLQNDPTRYEAGDMNLFRYVRDNPGNLTDPLGLKGGHHWFPQAKAFQDKLRKLCKDLNINQFTTPTVEAGGRQHHVGSPHGDSIHGHLTDKFKYNQRFAEILDKANSCCDLLMDLNDLMQEAAEEISKVFFDGAPVKFNIQSYSSTVDNAQDFMDLIEACYSKCKPRRRPVPVAVPEAVPQPVPPPTGVPPIALPRLTPAPVPKIRPVTPSLPFLLFIPLEMLGIDPDTGKPFGPSYRPRA
jgi:RHS repeat-associated protein